MRRSLLFNFIAIDGKGANMIEGTYRSKLIKKLKVHFPGLIVLHNNPNQIKGIPDLTLLYHNRYAMLETKMAPNSSKRPNQDTWISYFERQGAFSAFVNASNEKEIINELRRYFEV